MPGSAHRVAGITAIAAHRAMALFGRVETVSTGCCAAAHGTTTRRGFVPSAGATVPRPAGTTSAVVFVSPGCFRSAAEEAYPLTLVPKNPWSFRMGRLSVTKCLLAVFGSLKLTPFSGSHAGTGRTFGTYTGRVARQVGHQMLAGGFNFHVAGCATPR